MIYEAKDNRAGDPPAAGTVNSYAPPISVVLPFYNQTQYLIEAVESVLAAAPSGLELILINDGSTDKIGACAAIEQVQALRRPGFFIRIIETENRGLPSALNIGFAAASGQFLTWTSADNLFEPGALELLRRFLIDQPEVDLVYADVRLIDSSGAFCCTGDYRSSDRDLYDRSRLRLPRDSRALSAFPDNFINSCFMFRRRGYLSTGDHNPALVGLEDYDYWLRLFQLGRIEHFSISGDDRPLYRYRLHADSMTGTMNSDGLAKRTAERQALARTLSSYLSGDLAVRIAASREDLIAWEGLFTGTGVAIEAAPGWHGSIKGNKICLVARAKEGGRPADLGQGVPRIIRPTAIIDPIRRLAIGSKNGGVCYAVRAEERWATAISLNPDPALFRSRDSQFGAIVPAPGSYATAVLFVPDPRAGQEESLVRQLLGLYCGSIIGLVPAGDSRPPIAPSEASTDISIQPAAGRPFTLTLVCSTPAGRQIADAVNLALDDNRYLRILDLTPQLDFSDRSFVQSLVYILGSTDLIVSPSMTQFRGPDSEISIDAEINLLADLTLGAASGRAVAAVVRTETSHQPPGTEGSDKLALTISDAPQLVPLEALSPSGLLAALESNLPGQIWRPARASCDQWLELNSNSGALRQILAPLARASRA